MLENYAWAQNFSWGESKHPPLIGWITAIWFGIFPKTDGFYFLLAYASSAVGLLGVYHFAVAYGQKQQALSATLLLTLALPYSTLAAKYNANTILLSLWPWLAWGWIKAIKQPDWMNSLLLGALAALTLLGKYYSGTFLLSMLIATLATPEGRRWLLSKHMLTAAVFSLLLLTPHIIWLVEHEFVSLSYIQSKNEQRGDPLANAIRFVFIPFVYWLIPLVLIAWMLTSGKRKWQQRFKNIVSAWRFNRQKPDLFILALGPYLISLVFGFSGFVVLASPWAIPMGFAFTLLWLTNLDSREIDWPAIERGSSKAFITFLILILIVSPVYLWQQGKSGADNFYKPRAEAAIEILKEWHSRYPTQAPRWVGGSQWPELSLVSFYGDEQIIAYDGLPETSGYIVPPPDRWQEQPGMILCISGFVDNPLRQNCPALAESWLRQQAQGTSYFEVTVTKQGSTFPVHKPYRYRVYAYLPNDSR